MCEERPFFFSAQLNRKENCLSKSYSDRQSTLYLVHQHGTDWLSFLGLQGVLNALEMRIYGKGDVVGWVGEPHEGAILVTNGECVITRKILQASRRPDHIEDISISDGRSLPAGILYGEAALTTEANFGDSIVATSDNTHVSPGALLLYLSESLFLFSCCLVDWQQVNVINKFEGRSIAYISCNSYSG